MYNPQRYKSDDTTEAFDLMDQNPFATIITVVEGKPFLSHLPLTPKMVGNKIELIGHLARANPHWKSLAGTLATVIFHGPHTYITPKWYAENDVPTWNYSTVHVSGTVELVEAYDGIIECLKELTNHVERLWPSGWEFFVPDDLSDEILPKSIVGFKIKIDEINFKKKLSQNRTPADRAGVLRGLETRSDDNSRTVLADMLKLYSQNGESK
ncbi:MAG: FMN-binding negative transcriptional regulator [Bdellovibrionales bacterium]|nr:FMN-binding negative transcriptional regulator [Bdellovibrionales bacterium]